ncbi:MAG: hypothetical protein M3376_06160 [Actinomycetota bacterium]|nr:hypothetical protein [Actinomycetota bacterium]
MNAAGHILRVFSCALAVLAMPATSIAATPNRDPLPHADRADAPGSPLDLRAVTFAQRGTQLLMRITTEREWETSQLSSAAGRALCVNLYYGDLPTPRSRVCIFDGGEGRAGLTYSRLDPFGTSVSNGVVQADVNRPDKRSVEASFDAFAVNLGQGPYSWQALSKWSCDEPDACDDVSPDEGTVPDRITPLAEPPCFGAASRNPRFRCVNPELRLAVVPAPADVALTPNSPCALTSRELPYTCQFGVRSPRATRTVALIGDSHATHWRGALEVVAQTRGWSGYSLTRAGCPLSTATPDLDKARRTSCARWRNAVFAWFGRHPAVRTVFVSQAAGLDVRAPRGRSPGEYQIQGFIRAWRRLPRTVREIVVLRDTPVARATTPVCVQRARNRRRLPGESCALTRSRVLRHDPAAVAARRPNTARMHVVDMSRFMCSPKLCYPVVGGVLVHKDTTHLTSVFAATLGPFLSERVRGLLGG